MYVDSEHPNNTLDIIIDWEKSLRDDEKIICRKFLATIENCVGGLGTMTDI